MKDFLLSAIAFYQETGSTFYLVIGAIISTIPVYFFLISVGKHTFFLFNYKKTRWISSMHSALASEYVSDSVKSMIKDEVETEHFRSVFGKPLNKDTRILVEDVYTKIKNHINPKKLVKVSDFMVRTDKNTIIKFTLAHRLAFWYVTITVLTLFFGAAVFGGFFVLGKDYLSEQKLVLSLITALTLYISAIFMSLLNNEYWIAKRVKNLLEKEASKKNLDSKPEKDVSVKK